MNVLPPSFLQIISSFLVLSIPVKRVNYQTRKRKTADHEGVGNTHLVKSFLRTRIKMVARNPVKSSTVTHELIIENQ